MMFDSVFFFSRLAKYLLFLSFCSIICTFERVINPFDMFSMTVSTSFNLSSRYCLSLSLSS